VYSGCSRAGTRSALAVDDRLPAAGTIRLRLPDSDDDLGPSDAEVAALHRDAEHDYAEPRCCGGRARGWFNP